MPSTYSNQSSFKRKRSMPIFTIFTWLCCFDCEQIDINVFKNLDLNAERKTHSHQHQHQHGNNYLLCNSKSLESSTRSCSSFVDFFFSLTSTLESSTKKKKHTQTNKQKYQQNKQKSANGRALSGGRCEQKHQQQHQQINKHTQQSINS